MAGSADALEAGFIPTLIHGAIFGYHCLMARSVGAGNHFASPVDMAVGEEPTWAYLGINTWVGDGYNDA